MRLCEGYVYEIWKYKILCSTTSYRTGENEIKYVNIIINLSKQAVTPQSKENDKTILSLPVSKPTMAKDTSFWLHDGNTKVRELSR